MKKYDLFYVEKNKKAYLQDISEQKIVLSIDCVSKKQCNFLFTILIKNGFKFYDDKK